MKYIIDNHQPNPLSGAIALQGAKNSMLNNLCVPLLSEHECVIDNVPFIGDICLNANLLRSFGARVEWRGRSTLSICCNDIKASNMDAGMSLRTTGSKLFIPMMVARFGEYCTGPSGGCLIGDRQFRLYARSLENFGIKHEELTDDCFRFFYTGQHTSRYRQPFPSYGITVNAILAASAFDIELEIQNACREPEIDNTVAMINSMGGRIQRTTPDTISIRRRGHKLSGCHFRNLSDRNAAVTYMVMSLATRGEIVIDNFDDVGMEAFYKFLHDVGAEYVRSDGRIRVAFRGEILPSNIFAFLYPHFHSDWQPIVGALLTQAHGVSRIDEQLFPSRLEHWTELGKMGAKFQFCSGPIGRFNDDGIHAVEIFGPSPLVGCTVSAQNLRAGAALVIAALSAHGQTTIVNAEEIERGYDQMPDLLKSLGANIIVER